MSGPSEHPERPREHSTEPGRPPGWPPPAGAPGGQGGGSPFPWGGPPGQDHGWGPPPGFTPLEGPGTGHRAEPTDGFGRPLASWAQRVGALVLDTVILWVPSLVLVVAFAAAKASALGVLLALVANFAYFALLDGQSQTLGKRMIGIAVRDQRSGGPIGSGRALGRWVIYSVLWWCLFVPGLLNVLAPLWDQRRQAWHDRAVGSVVVQLR